MMKIKLLVAVLLVCFGVPARAEHFHEEHYYRGIWCAEHGGKTEVVMEDGTCCDCLREKGGSYVYQGNPDEAGSDVS